MGLFSKLFGNNKKQSQVNSSLPSTKTYKTREQILKEMEEQKVRVEKAKEEKRIAWDQELNSIPRHNIIINDDKFEKLVYPDGHEYKFTNLTIKTDLDKLGNFVIIDTETTGLKSTAGILELSAIKYVNFEPVEIFDTFIKPKQSSWEEAEAINHITKEMVENSPKLEQVTQDFLNFVGNNDIVGHNLEFDLKILAHKGICFLGKRKFYDTLSLSRSKYKEYKQYDLISNFKLNTLGEVILHIYRHNAHRSDSDCLLTGKLYLSIIENMQKEKEDIEK